MKPWSESIALSAPLLEAGLAPSSAQLDAPTRASWQAGYDQGRDEGEKSLSGQLLKQREELHQVLHGTVESLRQSVPQVIRDTENMMISLALEVAKKLVSDMPISAEMVEAAVRDALAHVESSAQITIRLNPHDLELLQKSGSPLLAQSGTSNDFRFVSSSEVTRGGCLVETRFGTVDCRRETKMELLEKDLLS